MSGLNPPQQEAVHHGGGPLLVLAGAGSGKTRVITHRIAHLIAQGVPPEAIAAVTFTNKAAEEMRERVGKLVRDRKLASKLTVSTFHSLGMWMLREERKSLGFARGFAIYDQADQLGVVREIVRHLELGKKFDVKAVLARISLAKNAFVAPEDYVVRPGDEYDEATAQVYPKYQEQLRAFHAFDFDDLLTEIVRLLDRDDAVRDRWRSRFQFVMVDEYQDTNRAQLLLVKHLVADHGNLMVVGDDDQSIYSWRGADPTNILGFTDMFAGAKIIKLEQNYRSTKTVLAAANAVIANNKLRHGKTLWSDHADGEPITHAVAADPEIEAKWVAQEICRLHDGGKSWEDIAVLYRSNIQSKLLEEELRTASVPYVMYGGQQFFERKEVKDLIAYLRVALNPRDELALRRIVNYPARGVGSTTIDRLSARAIERHAPLWDVAKAASAEDDDEIKGGARRGLFDVVTVIERLAKHLDGGDTVAATNQLIEDIGLYDDLRHASPSMSAADRRIDNVKGLLGTLQRGQERKPGRDALADLLRHLSLSHDKDEDEDDGSKVILTTLHGAKGLEFPVVFMVGLEEELLPHARTLQPNVTDAADPDHVSDLSEERRLCYVGITRAQRKLYLTRACQRVTRGRSVVRTPSRFLLEIPDELLEVRDLAEEARQKVPVDEVRSFFSRFSLED